MSAKQSSMRRSGGKRAAAKREPHRAKIEKAILSVVKDRAYWDDLNINIKVLVKTLFEEIESARNAGHDWQGISPETFTKARFGKQTVSDIVSLSRVMYRLRR